MRVGEGVRAVELRTSRVLGVFARSIKVGIAVKEFRAL